MPLLLIINVESMNSNVLSLDKYKSLFFKRISLNVLEYTPLSDHFYEF
jgi:hypothetical protein